jgi:hypothetical protein
VNLTQTRKVPATHRRYKRGKLLEIINLQYGTALGLIYAGVLPRPPIWTQAKLQAPVGEVDPELASIEPTIVKDRALTLLGATLKQGKEYALFDLTHLE